VFYRKAPFIGQIRKDEKFGGNNAAFLFDTALRRAAHSSSRLRRPTRPLLRTSGSCSRGLAIIR